MLRVKDLPPEEMQEVVRVAGELYDREHAEARERKATRDAAEEMGIPPEYLERAAVEVHARRVEKVQRTRRRSRIAVATIAAALAIGGGWRVLNPPPPTPLVDTMRTASQRWTRDVNPQSEAILRFEGDAAVIRVERFAPNAENTFYANLETRDGSKSLTGFRTASFRVRGTGLGQVRFDLENGNERWRSPALPVTGEWQTHRIPLDQFERQTRQGGRWRTVSYRAPGTVRNFSFKVGDFINDIRSKGEVAIDDLRFE